MDARRWRAAGRPPNATRPDVAAADRAIALTVHRLTLWGFPQDSRHGARGVFEVVGDLALEILNRHDGSEWRRALGPDQVAKIYKAWRLSERARAAVGDRRAPLERASYTKRSLALRRPLRYGWTLQHYALALLEAGGRWNPRGAEVLLDTFDLQLAPKAGSRKTR